MVKSISLVSCILLYAPMVLGIWNPVVKPSSFPVFTKFVRVHQYYVPLDREMISEVKKNRKGHDCERSDVFTRGKWQECLRDELFDEKYWTNPGIAVGVPQSEVLGGNLNISAVTTDIIPNFKPEYYRLKFVQHETDLPDKCFLNKTKGYMSNGGVHDYFVIIRRHLNGIQFIPSIPTSVESVQIFDSRCASLGKQNFMPILVGRLQPFYFRVIDRDWKKENRRGCLAAKKRCHGARLKTAADAERCKKTIGDDCRGQQELIVVDDQLFQTGYWSYTGTKSENVTWIDVPISDWRNQKSSPLTSDYKFLSLTVVTEATPCDQKYLVPYTADSSRVEVDISHLIKVVPLYSSVQITSINENGTSLDRMMFKYNECWGMNLLTEAIFVKRWANPTDWDHPPIEKSKKNIRGHN